MNSNTGLLAECYSQAMIGREAQSRKIWLPLMPPRLDINSDIGLELSEYTRMDKHIWGSCSRAQGALEAEVVMATLNRRLLAGQ